MSSPQMIRMLGCLPDAMVSGRAARAAAGCGRAGRGVRWVGGGAAERGAGGRGGGVRRGRGCRGARAARGRHGAGWRGARRVRARVPPAANCQVLAALSRRARRFSALMGASFRFRAAGSRPWRPQIAGEPALTCRRGRGARGGCTGGWGTATMPTRSVVAARGGAAACTPRAGPRHGARSVTAEASTGGPAGLPAPCGARPGRHFALGTTLSTGAAHGGGGSPIAPLAPAVAIDGALQSRRPTDPVTGPCTACPAHSTRAAAVRAPRAARPAVACQNPARWPPRRAAAGRHGGARCGGVRTKAGSPG
jgi:hypothetical protein